MYADVAQCNRHGDVVCPSDTNVSPAKTDQHAICVVDSVRPKEPCIKWGSRSLLRRGNSEGERDDPLYSTGTVYHKLFKNGCTHRDADWYVNLLGYKEACIRWRCTLVPPAEYDCTACVRQQCFLSSNYSDHLFTCCSTSCLLQFSVAAKLSTNQLFSVLHNYKKSESKELHKMRYQQPMPLIFQPDRSCSGFGYMVASPVFLFWPHIYIAPTNSRKASSAQPATSYANARSSCVIYKTCVNICCQHERAHQAA